MRKTILLFCSVFVVVSLCSQSIEPLRITHGPWLQNLTHEGVTVCWITNHPAVPGIWITGMNSNPDQLVRNSTDGLIDAGGTLHKVRVKGLQPGVKYTYKLQSVELLKLRPYQIYFGDTIKSKDFSFTTMNPSNKTTRFMVVNDIHTNGGKLAGFLKSGSAIDQDLVLFNGDIVDNFETEAQLLGPIIDTSVRYFASYVPFAFVRGNHETRGIMSRQLKNYLDLPDNRYYYSFDQGPVHFVILDCGEDKPDDNRYYYGLADYDYYRLQQLEWLKEHLKSKAYRDAAFRIIVVHMPIIPYYSVVYGRFPLLIKNDRGYGPNFLAEHFGPVLREAGADLMISGHTHRHLWLNPPFSGYQFPILINGNSNYVTAEASAEKLSLKVVSEKEKVILSKEIYRK
jgi:acid phosphatase type 7